MLNSLHNYLPKQQKLNPLKKLIAKYPLVILGATGLSVAVVGIKAMTALFDPGEVSPPAPNSLPSPTIFEEVEQEPIFPPLWLIGAIAAGGIAGSIIIVQTWKYRVWLLKPLQKLKPKPFQFQVNFFQRKKKRRIIRKKRPVNYTLPQLPPARSRMPSTEPVITVLPPDEPHFLDNEQDSLAEQVDLRKRHSLTSFLIGD